MKFETIIISFVYILTRKLPVVQAKRTIHSHNIFEYHNARCISKNVRSSQYERMRELQRRPSKNRCKVIFFNTAANLAGRTVGVFTQHYSILTIIRLS